MKTTPTALFLAAVALAVSPWNTSYAAGPHGLLNAASQMSGFVRTKPWIPTSLQPAVTYAVDDGISEDAIGFGPNGTKNWEAIWLNQFDVIPGQTTITSVEIAWGSPVLPSHIDGLPIKVGIWSDPNNDRNPSDAVLLASFAGTIQQSGTDTFVTYKLSPAVTLPAGATSFFVGDMTPMNDGPEVFPQGFDETTTHRQSWVAGNDDGSSVDIVYLGNNNLIGLIDDFGLPGNWMIRADATLPAFFLQSAASVKQGFAVDSGTVEDRVGGPQGKYTLVMTFNQEVTSLHGASTTCGSAARATIDTTDPHNVVISLTGVGDDCNASEITVIASGVRDSAGDTVQKARVTFGLLIGDINGDRVVDEADLAAINAVKGQTTDETNFRADLNADGIIDRVDLNGVQEALGTSLP